MATSRTNGNRHDPRDPDRERAAAARAEVVDILAGAVLSLLLQRGPRPSPDEALGPRKALNLALSGPFRTPE